MHTYIAFLRAVNMAGHNSVKMKDISALFTDIGFSKVETYIQSGNIIFQTATEDDYSRIIEENILSATGFNITVMIRTPDQLKKLIKSNPFRDPGKFNPGRVAVLFLTSEPGEDVKAKMSDYDFSPDKFVISEKNVFIFCPDGFGRSKLSTGFFEKKMGIKCTARNWNTVNAILEIAEKL
jgi:uncharacterized protein (DUF1697 family)